MSQSQPFFAVMLMLVLAGVIVVLLFGSSRRSGKIWAIVALVIAMAAVAFIAGVFVVRSSGRLPVVVMPQPRPELRKFPVHAPATIPATQTNWLWVNDWSAFVSTTNFNGFRAESTDSAPTDSDSRTEAINDAARGLTQMVLAHPRLTRPLAQRNDIERQVTAVLNSGSLINGRYVYRTDRSYGSLYKTYLLIDTSPSKLDPLVRQINQQISVTRQRNLTAAGSVAATVLVVLLLYAFLNTVTKGYFVWKLRAAMILLMIGAVMAAAVMM